jgi:hypothetical protein
VPPEPPRITVLRLDLRPHGGLASGKARLADIVSAAGTAGVPSEAGVEGLRLEAVRACVSASGGDSRSGRCGHGAYFQVEHMSRCEVGGHVAAGGVISPGRGEVTDRSWHRSDEEKRVGAGTFVRTPWTRGGGGRTTAYAGEVWGQPCWNNRYAHQEAAVVAQQGSSRTEAT